MTDSTSVKRIQKTAGRLLGGMNSVSRLFLASAEETRVSEIKKNGKPSFEIGVIGHRPQALTLMGPNLRQPPVILLFLRHRLGFPSSQQALAVAQTMIKGAKKFTMHPKPFKPALINKTRQEKSPIEVEFTS